MDSQIQSKINSLTSSLNTFKNKLSSVEQDIKKNGKGLGLDDDLKKLSRLQSNLSSLNSKLRNIR